MKSGKMIAALIGVWLMFIGFDSAHAKIGKKGVTLLPRPVQLSFTLLRAVRSILLFKIAVLTFFCISHQLTNGLKKEKKV